MFCSKCGKEISEDTKFCNHCGAQQGGAVNEKPSDKKNKAKKSPKKVMLSLAAMLVCYLVGSYVIAPAMLSDSGEDNDTGNSSVQSQLSNENNDDSSADSANPVYDAIFDDTYIVHFPTFFNMEMNNYAMKGNDGTIYCADYGYKDDVVKEWVETIYIPVSEYTDTQKLELENSMKSQFAKIDSLNCCTVDYKMSTNYLTITCTYSDVDKAENYTELYNAQILQANTLASMSETETGLLNQGFVKK